MKHKLPLMAVGAWVILFALARCGTTAPLPELLSDAGTDAGTALRIDTSQLQTGIPGVPYLEQLQATGGTLPLRWSLDQRPAELAWVQLGDRGQLYGTPTAVTSGTLTASVHDALDAGAQVSLPLSVVECEEGAQYPCEVGDAGVCEIGVTTCNAGRLGSCGGLQASTSVFGCGPGCSACDPTRANTCVDGGTCSCGSLGQECAPGGTCCPGTDCVDLSIDPNHCKSCDNDCAAKAPPHMDAGCGDQDCTYACSPGYTDCDGKWDSGCEVNTAGDIRNCGGCGNLCSTNHDLPTCSGGSCQVACISDSTGHWANCNADAGDGCEVDLNTSTDHCGDCSTACSRANASPSCDGGICSFACAPGWANCQPGNDGCETPESPTHCGSSCVVCPGPTSGSGSATCTSGKCGIQCASGLTLCGTSCVDLTTDNNNCGACGNVCSDWHSGAMCDINSTGQPDCSYQSCIGTKCNLVWQ